MPSENPDEFPVVTAFEEEKYHEMPARFFRETIRRTVFATDNESSRYALGGVLIELTGDQITAVATDGRRLARQEGPAKAVGSHQSGDRTTIIPTRAMQLLERALADNDENIQLAARDNDVLVKSGRATIYSRLVEGRFPKWRDVFPRRENNLRVELTAGPFYAAVRQAAIVTSEESAAWISPSARERWCWPPTARNMANRTSRCPSPTTARRWSLHWIPAT